jgi:hypothetical protein
MNAMAGANVMLPTTTVVARRFPTIACSKTNVGSRRYQASRDLIEGMVWVCTVVFRRADRRVFFPVEHPAAIVDD